MTLTRSEMETIRRQFDSRCRKILREESYSIRKRLARRAEKEVSLSWLSEKELNRFYVIDEYPSDLFFFDAAEYRIPVRDEKLASALAALPDKKRDVILLAFFLDMKDTEIAAKLKVVGSTIHRRRTSSLEELRSRLEVFENERNKK
ncbi:sigma-70 family RNA polymerase sigma factor [Oscillibacter hominis]|uniref:Sigma-70 family RNA polymerase sigma factor n=1 Tax=Oscillibacter hominis TaxID=2763056 RepID=A0A7G9B3H1_9FIRM|nr:sigma factor-like helix-turn-helix DNA-binding protein [Oscillibacter hominis]QNL44102.1 sigma-70 family RNA polymerase sigma factor [Oscillibacter hominis]